MASDNAGSTANRPSLTTILSVLGILGAAFAATVTATWHFRGTQLTERLEAYEDLRNMQLPTTVAELRQASEQLRLDSQEREELQGLRSQFAVISQTITAQQSELATAQARAAEAEAVLRETFGDFRTTEVAAAESVTIVPNIIIMGIDSIGASSVQVNIGNETVDLRVGNVKEIPYGDRVCIVHLVKINSRVSNTAEFSYGCPQ